MYVLLVFLFVILAGITFYFASWNGGAQIFKQCHASFKEDGSLVLSCQRELGRPFYTERLGLTKTMKITKVKEKFGYYIVSDGKRNWAILPKNIPLKDLINIQK